MVKTHIMMKIQNRWGQLLPTIFIMHHIFMLSDKPSPVSYTARKLELFIPRMFLIGKDRGAETPQNSLREKKQDVDKELVSGVYEIGKGARMSLIWGGGGDSES